MIAKTNNFTILPSVSSMMIEMIVVVALFFVLNIYIIYLSAYDSGYKPNFVLLLNFIFDDSTSLKNFKTYVKNVAIDEVSNAKQRETFVNQNDSFLSKPFVNQNDNFVSGTLFWFKKNFIKLFVNGNRIRTTQRV